MRLSHNSFLVSLLLPLPTIHAWGQLPHRTIAVLSTRFLLPDTAKFLRRILPPNESIPTAAIWADYYSHTPEGRWSGELHYIDAHDSPDTGECGVDFARDCRAMGRCVVGGIVNVTEQVQVAVHREHEDDGDPESRKRQEEEWMVNFYPEFNTTMGTPHWSSPTHLALRFLLHFIADIHQPLHTESSHRGGNSLPVLFRGRHTNLHSAWDTLIPEYLLNLHPPGRRATPRDAVAWADRLHSRILRMDVRGEEFQRNWVGECFNGIDDVERGDGKGEKKGKEEKLTREKAQECALEWASWANKYVCEYVFAGEGGVEGMIGRELVGDGNAEEDGEGEGGYAEGARELVEELVGMAGWRLAGWLNLLVVGRTGLDLGGVSGGGEGKVQGELKWNMDDMGL